MMKNSGVPPSGNPMIQESQLRRFFGGNVFSQNRQLIPESPSFKALTPPEDFRLLRQEVISTPASGDSVYRFHFGWLQKPNPQIQEFEIIFNDRIFSFKESPGFIDLSLPSNSGAIFQLQVKLRNGSIHTDKIPSVSTRI